MSGLDAGQLVSFKIGNEMYAAPIAKVQEIIRMPDIVTVPKAPSFIKGVINLRGRILPVIDLKTKFEVTIDISKKDNRIVITDINGVLLGLIVDAVSEVLQVTEDMYEEAPNLISNTQQKFIKGVVKKDDEMIMVLDVDKILSEEETGVLKTVK